MVPAEPEPGVYVTEHVATAPLPESMQLVGLKTPEPLVLQVTAPEGVIAIPREVSVTVAVQVVSVFTGIVLGIQFTLVVVERLVTCRSVEPELPE